MELPFQSPDYSIIRLPDSPLASPCCFRAKTVASTGLTLEAAVDSAIPFCQNHWRTVSGVAHATVVNEHRRADMRTRWTRFGSLASALALVVVPAGVIASGEGAQGPAPDSQAATAKPSTRLPAKSWSAPRTPWGDPDV